MANFTGWNNYMMNLSKLMTDGEAMKCFGNTVVVWNLHTRVEVLVADAFAAPIGDAGSSW